MLILNTLPSWVHHALVNLVLLIGDTFDVYKYVWGNCYFITKNKKIYFTEQ